VESAATYYLLINDQQAGPFTEDEIRAKFSAGEITDDTLAWKEGMAEWAALHTLGLNLSKPRLKLKSHEGAPAAGPPPLAAPAGGGLQFDRAEFAGTPTAAARSCATCKSAIETSYYEVNGNVVCPKCRDELQASLTGGSGLLRFIKAAAVGTAAAGIGSGIWYGISRLTGYEFGLIAIVIGLMVGFAVRWGSGGRGGWVYQLLAIFLTYTSIVVTYIPYLIAIVIIGIGLYEAWKLNQRTVIDIKGPFQAAGPGGQTPTSA
jgi:hypothetical protein